MSRRLRGRLAEALLVLAAILIPLLALEAFLRLKGEDTRSWTRPDPVLGWSSIPGAKYVHVPAEKCAGWGSSGRINSLGLRDREIPYQKPPGTIRMLALGDSFTEAFQFDLERTWTKLLEARLNARGDGRRYEVINAGRSGMGTTLEWLFFANEGKKYDPDLVLLLFIANDFQENSKRLALATAYGPYLVRGAGWKLRARHELSGEQGLQDAQVDDAVEALVVRGVGSARPLQRVSCVACGEAPGEGAR